MQSQRVVNHMDFVVVDDFADWRRTAQMGIFQCHSEIIQRTFGTKTVRLRVFIRSEEHTSVLQSRDNLVCCFKVVQSHLILDVIYPVPYTTLYRSTPCTRDTKV